MAEFGRDRQAHARVGGALLGAQRPPRRAASGRAGPAGEFGVALLGVAMAQAVYAVDAGALALGPEDLELIPVAQVGGDQAAVAGESFGFVEQRALGLGADGDFAGAAALGRRAKIT